MVRYSWDRAKSAANLRERGFDFAFATLVFGGPTVVAEDQRQDYGERRFVAIGLADKLHLTVVFTDRVRADGELERRIISARRSNRRREESMPSGSRSRKSPTRGRADLHRLRRMGESEIDRTSPPELTDLPDDFWSDAVVVEPVSKRAISLRLDEDVLTWFKSSGPRYQSRINAVLRSYMAHMRKRNRRRGAA